MEKSFWNATKVIPTLNNYLRRIPGSTKPFRMKVYRIGKNADAFITGFGKKKSKFYFEHLETFPN